MIVSFLSVKQCPGLAKLSRQVFALSIDGDFAKRTHMAATMHNAQHHRDHSHNKHSEDSNQ